MKKLLILFFLLSLYQILYSQTAGDEDREMFNKGKDRDQKAIDEAINTWWTASMKTHDQRIQWWKEAKFGMFIHWGIYSLPGGEWNGKKVSGYAEHLMRKEKISRSDYLDIAHHFNPIKFNAEEWILQAKKAGMKYFIITSKHHDGFAMFDSQVSDFDIIDQTPFKRDPMAELAAAAKKYGIKFGFYYSHAFDWENPDAPGNDWEYKNPGGDLNLYGGREWYDLHPDLLTKAQHYVDEKVIPQIRELILKYHPDILWFDTPQKLPLSENVRILKAIREADPNVVVNGRLVRSASANLGDYKNTADRPAEFFPVTGDWEAIPTTNESYGYSKFDSSHKPVSHFIRLLANAASRGGNLLMNIGPRGDGSFDARDINILNGIGSWMSKNGESIYGTSAGQLPLQSWGVSTQKNNKVYLHVFQWPVDGKLYVGGVGKNISKVYLLNEPSKIFPVKYLPGGDIVITVPSKAPDSINTVLCMEGKIPAAIETDSRLLAPNVINNRFLAFDALQKGKGFGFGDGKTDRYYVEGWKSNEQTLSWNLHVIKTSDMKMKIRYLAPAASSGGRYSIAFYGRDGNLVNQHLYNVKTTSGTVDVTEENLDVIHLPVETYNLVIKPERISNQELMKLLEIQMIQIPSNAIELQKIISDAEKQTKFMLQEIPKAKPAQSGARSGVTPGSLNAELVSPRTLDSGKLKLVSSRDWTSGFFPGQLWFLYEFTGKKEWRSEAEKYTANIEREKTNGGTHDMGFKIYSSFGNGYRLTKDSHYRDVIIEGARTLSTRFNPVAGVIRSWDNRARWKYPVIIDNMMNLELLFEATKLTGDSSFYRIAVSHATTTMKNHFRSDYSSYHVLDYDTVTGKVVQKTTHQGFSDESAWSRGQAWGLYGFTMCYRETGNKSFLEHAEHIAAFLLNHPRLPSDGIPYYDFDASGIPSEPRDASAAAIMASALYELSTYSKNAKEYRKAADKIIENLTRYYRSPIGDNRGFILLHSTGSKPPNSEVDVPINYADYYYLESLQRMDKLKKGKSLFQKK